MPLSNIDSVARQAAALLDDPSCSVYTFAYQRPFIDQCYEKLDNDLTRIGMQYVEGLVSFDVQAMVSDLSYLLEDGQPLADMKQPKYLWWKIPGQPDSNYVLAELVEELSYPQNLAGVNEWRNANGAIQINPSVIDVTIKVSYDMMSTLVYDPLQQTIRGTAGLLATRVARMMASVRRGMEKRAQDLRQQSIEEWNVFKSVSVMKRQGKSTVPPRLHPTRRAYTPTVLAPTNPSQ